MNLIKPTIAIFSDLHLGVHNNSNTWHKVAIDWCDWFISELHAKNIKDVVFCGDWHHNRSEIYVHTLDVSAMLIDKISKDFNLHLVLGNHDVPFKHGTNISSVSVYSNRPNVKVYTKMKYLEAFDKKICFAPWGSELNDLEKCDVIFGHLEIQTFKMTVGKVCSSGWSATDILSKCSTVFSGHFHIRCEKTYNEGNIVYTGNPFQMDFGDCGDTKGYYLFDLDTEKYTFVPNRVSPEHHKIKLSKILKEGVEHFKHQIINNVVRIDVDVEHETKELFKIFDQVSAYKPIDFTHDYTYITPVAVGDVGDNNKSVSIDVSATMSDYVDSIDIYGKDKCKTYLSELYEKCK